MANTIDEGSLLLRFSSGVLPAAGSAHQCGMARRGSPPEFKIISSLPGVTLGGQPKFRRTEATYPPDPLLPPSLDEAQRAGIQAL